MADISFHPRPPAYDEWDIQRAMARELLTRVLVDEVERRGWVVRWKRGRDRLPLGYPPLADDDDEA